LILALHEPFPRREHGAAARVRRHGLKPMYGPHGGDAPLVHPQRPTTYARSAPVAARRGRACSGLGTASRVFLLRHSFQAVSQTGTVHPRPKLRQSYSNFGLVTDIGLHTSLSRPRVRDAASWPASHSALAGRVRGPQLSVHRVDRVLDRAPPPAAGLLEWADNRA
jgi:hypothetical protein